LLYSWSRKIREMTPIRIDAHDRYELSGVSRMKFVRAIVDER
jgi:hypothetical protein